MEGIDYFDTFSPAVRYKSMKYMLALAAKEDMEIKQLDYDTAFLNATLEEEIFVRVPDGYLNTANAGCLKLVKALYGLKQAPREWWKEINGHLESLGYKACELDECLYMKSVNGKAIYLTLYVDDTLAIFHKDLEEQWNLL